MSNLKKRIIGQVLPTPKGDWSPLTSYITMDFVMYEGNGYVCVEDNRGFEPSNWTTKWTLVSLKGGKGDKGDRGEKGEEAPEYKGTYKSTEIYNEGYVVYYNGDSYICLKDNVTGITPNSPEDENTWQIICKGVDYKLLLNGEVIFYKDNKSCPAKNYVNNVYIKRNDSLFINPNDESISEITLKKKLDDMQLSLKRCVWLLKYYDMWFYRPGEKPTDIESNLDDLDELDDTNINDGIYNGNNSSSNDETSNDNDSSSDDGIITEQKIINDINKIKDTFIKLKIWDKDENLIIDKLGGIGGGCCM